MMWGWDDGGAWVGILMMIMMVLFWVAIIVGAVFLIRALLNRDRQAVGFRGETASHASTAVRVLEERYARGEIDQEEFLRRRRDLTGV